MSSSPIARSPDLLRLLDKHYHVRIEAGWLIVGAVPYVDGQRRVRRGRLLMPLPLAGGVAVAPVRWKRLRGFYRDLEGEHQSAFLIDGNLIINADPSMDTDLGPSG